MRIKLFVVWVLWVIEFFAGFISCTADANAQELRVGYLITTGQRPSFEKVFDRFTKETGIRVIGVPRKDAEYRRDVPVWLLQGKDTPDILYWQASQRLYYYAGKSAIRPISQLWKDDSLDKNFSQVRSGVVYKGEIYALPVHYYSWGLYFKKSVIEQYGGIPTSWEEFVAQCSRIKNAGITPIGLGTLDRWPVAAWFDYIDLRLNGLEFHLKLLNGEVPFTDIRAQRVLIEWKRLIDNNFFNNNSARIDWDEVFPYMYRNQIAFTLSGNFVQSKLPGTLTDTIGIASFPRMNNGIDVYEDAPMNVMLIPSAAKNITEAEKFIRFMARSDVQSELASGLGYLPASKSGTIGQGEFIQAEASMLHKAAGIAQYFDRDTVPSFEQKALPILIEFMKTADVRKTTELLEKARKESFHE